MPHRIVAITVALLVAAACDPEGDLAATKARPTPTSPEPAPGARSASEVKGLTVAGPAGSEEPASPAASAAERTTVAGERSGFVECLLGCDAARMSRAEKAVCRYNCEGAGPSAPDTALAATIDADPVASVVRCMGGCAGKGKQAAAPCMNACKRTVDGAPAAPTAAVLDELGVCIEACHTGRRTSETNRATCELSCADIARVAGPAQGAGARPGGR